MSLFDGPPPDPAASSAGIDVPPSSPDPVCEVCGKALTYAGRGRKPTRCDEHKKSRSGASSTSRGASAVSDRELNTACESLHQLYDMLVFPLAAIDPSEDGAANVWLQQIPSLDARNRAILANNRDLVRKINSAGERGGTFAFAVSHLVAIGPVGMILIGRARVRAAERRAAREAEYVADVPADEWAFSPRDGMRPPAPNPGTFFDADLDLSTRRDAGA